MVSRHSASLMLLVGLGIMLGPLPVLSEQASEFTVDSPRPLADVLDQLENHLGQVITYEDPEWLFAGDVKSTSRSTSFVVPKGGAFRFRLPEIQSGNRAEQVIQAVLRDFGTARLGGTFRMVRHGTIVHIVPLEARGSDGRLRPEVPVLDQRVSLNDAPRSALDVLQELRDGSGGRLLIGRITPRFVLANTKLVGGADKEPMRDILARTLEAAGPALSYRLFCQPGTPNCYLNVHLVEALKPFQPGIFIPPTQ
jgi:hypothetical protein